MTSRSAATSNWADRFLAINGSFVFAFLYLPIVIVVVFSFSASENVGIWGGFSLQWYETMFANEQLMNSLQNSVIIAVISTAVATVLGTAAALSLNRYRRWIGRGAFDGLLYLPIIIPDVAMAVMLLMWFTQTDLVPFGRTSITLAHIAFNISFVAIIVRARLANMDPAMEDAASDLYAGRWKTFSKVTLPLILPGVLGGALLALTLSLDDVVITSFVQGPGATTLPVYVFGLIRKSITPEINAVSTLMITISMVLVLGSLGLQQRAERRN
jgi:spermidine/putrescine transport system permease protein